MRISLASALSAGFPVCHKGSQSPVGSAPWTGKRARPKADRRTPAGGKLFAVIVAQSCLTLCDPMDGSTPGLPVLHHLLEFAQTHVHGVGDVIQPSHSLYEKLYVT